ncbi:hypothetical protein J2786_001455 [Chryseobacterium vietnamense]|uniref:Uncharacterized protein n=1 Tax=Chryseobacterium vietnamense TaxID=866785 RepID=A0ACC6J6G5_9FLAO|nr:hypothetical protein [Chryseobacterium vietnamense]
MRTPAEGRSSFVTYIKAVRIPDLKFLVEWIYSG